MPAQAMSLTGQEYGMLTVLELYGRSMAYVHKLKGDLL